MHPSAIPRDATGRDVQLTLADGLVDALVASEIDTFFGVPGGAIEPLFNALARARERGTVTVIATRSESGAGFAADGYYRATGRLAVCTATTGPGITNLITAVANAHADRTPMLVLTPQVSLAKHGRVHPADLMRWLSEELPEQVVVHVDSGNSFSWSTRAPMADRVRGLAEGVPT